MVVIDAAPAGVFYAWRVCRVAWCPAPSTVKLAQTYASKEDLPWSSHT